MSKISRQELLATIVGGRSLVDWDSKWEPLSNAFSQPHPELEGVVGLFRVLRSGETKYIVRATEPRGIPKGLKRISGIEQTGNQGYGAQMIRKHIKEVKVDILRVEGGCAPEVAKGLKKAMNRLYDPEWAKPFKRRMEDIRAGRRPAD